MVYVKLQILNKQKKTYLLLTAVLLVWSIIGFQIYKKMNPSAIEENVLKVYSGKFNREELKEISFYEIKKIYRDPFLGVIKNKKRKIKLKKNLKKTKREKIIRFPNIRYNGIVAGEGTKCCILTIKNTQEILKLGDSINGVKLLEVKDKQIVVEFKEKKKIIKLQ